MRFLLLFTILFLSCFEAFAQNYNSIINKTRQERFTFLWENFYGNEAILKDSVSFFTEVSKLRKEAEKANDRELVLETEFLKYSFLSSKGYAPYIEEVTGFKKRLDKEGIKQLQARVRQALGFHYFYETKQYEKAIENFSQSYKYLKDLSYDDLPDKQEMVYNIAFVYYHIGYFGVAFEYLEKAEKLKSSYYYYEHLTVNILNTKGMILEAKGEFENSIAVYQKVYELSLEKNFEVWKRISQNNIGRGLYLQKKYDEALKILDTNEENFLQWEPNISIKRHTTLASVYIALNRHEEAVAEVEKLEKFLVETEKVKKDNWRIGHKEEILQLRAYVKNQKKDYAEAYILLDSTLHTIREINEAKNIELLRQTEYKEDIERYLRQQQELEYQKKTVLLSRIGIVIILILSIIIIFVLVQKQKVLYKNKRMKLELEKQEISRELESATSKLNQLTAFLHEKNKEIQTFQGELDALEQTKENSTEVKERKQKLNKLLEKAILTDENWIQFKKAFEEVYPDFITKLNSELKGLSQAEIRYIVLRKSGLQAKEIASILGILPDSIRLYKYRIKKKFNFKDDSELENIISDL